MDYVLLKNAAISKRCFVAYLVYIRKANRNYVESNEQANKTNES